MVKSTVAHEAVRSIIRLIGDDPDRPGLRDTPARVFRAWKELFAGYTTDPAALLKTFDDIDNDEMIVLRNCNFQSWCEHHMLPFSGVAHVGYLPEKGRVVGLSKLARLVDCFALRLQVQERMTVEVADALLHGVRAKGVGVVVEADEICGSDADECGEPRAAARAVVVVMHCASPARPALRRHVVSPMESDERAPTLRIACRPSR